MKFKNIKKKAKKKKSPSNSRSITEHSKFSFPTINSAKLLKLYGGVLKVFVFLVFAAAIIVVGLDFQKNMQIKQNIDFQRETLSHSLIFWENFMTKHQNYGDAYFQASILEYKLGNTPKAKMYAEKGLSLNPSSKDGRGLEQFLTNK